VESVGFARWAVLQTKQLALESIASSATKRSIRSGRLIPADGFYRWQRNGKTKQPYCLQVGDGELFVFAGLWDRWTNPQREVIESCAPPGLGIQTIHPESCGSWRLVDFSEQLLSISDAAVFGTQRFRVESDGFLKS
jgi:hypothetical protein